MELEEIVKIITKILDNIIEEYKEEFRETGSFKVTPGYGYDKFYLDWVEGSYDMSLYSLIHYIMYEEGIYKKILTDEQYKKLEELIEEYPESIYGPDMDEDPELVEKLDAIYDESISFVEEKLTSLGFDVKGVFYPEDEYPEDFD